MLLSWMFISSYITIFFCNWIYLFECLNISVNTIFKCIYMFFGWERSHQLRMYATGGAIGGLSKCVQLCIGGKGVTPPSLFMFLAAFLSYSVLFYLQKFDLIFILKRCFCQKRLFFSNKINFYRNEISFFYLKLFYEPKLAKMLLILIK